MTIETRRIDGPAVLEFLTDALAHDEYVLFTPDGMVIHGKYLITIMTMALQPYASTDDHATKH